MEERVEQLASFQRVSLEAVYTQSSGRLIGYRLHSFFGPSSNGNPTLLLSVEEISSILAVIKAHYDQYFHAAILRDEIRKERNQ